MSLSGESDFVSTREVELERALQALVRHLDHQHWCNTPPGAYHYSPNVTDALGTARRLVKVPVPVPDPSDVGGPNGTKR